MPKPRTRPRHPTAALTCLLLSGCGAPNIHQFATGAPSMAPDNWMAGTAADITGTATGTQAGNAWHLSFNQNLPVNGHELAVHVEDWRIRESNNVAIDISTISKLGIRLAVSDIAFVKGAD